MFTRFKRKVFARNLSQIWILICNQLSSLSQNFKRLCRFLYSTSNLTNWFRVYAVQGTYRATLNNSYREYGFLKWSSYTENNSQIFLCQRYFNYGTFGCFWEGNKFETSMRNPCFLVIFSEVVKIYCLVFVLFSCAFYSNCLILNQNKLFSKKLFYANFLIKVIYFENMLRNCLI